MPLSAQSQTIPQLSCPTSVLSSPHNMHCRVLLYPTTAIINLLILFSRSLSPNETQEMSPLFHHYHILYVFLFILDLGLSANDPVNPISSIHLHQTKSCPNYKSTYLFASNLSFAVPTLNYFHSFNFFRPTSFVQ